MGPIKFLNWLQRAMQALGMDILLDGDRRPPLKIGEERVKRLVFIGRNLPKAL